MRLVPSFAFLGLLTYQWIWPQNPTRTIVVEQAGIHVIIGKGLVRVSQVLIREGTMSL